MLTSANDMSKLLIELMRTFEGESEKIISRETLKLMLTRQAEVPSEVLGFPIGMGLGVFVDGEGDNVSFMHPGHSYPGTTYIILAFPGLGQGMAMGVNGNKGDRLEIEAASTLAEMYGWPSGDYYAEQAEE